MNNMCNNNKDINLKRYVKDTQQRCFLIPLEVSAEVGFFLNSIGDGVELGIPYKKWF